MDLTVPEVAALLKRSVRAIRRQAERGAIPASKKNGRWHIPRQSLPLTESQRRILQTRAEEVRTAVDAALPPRLASSPGDRRRSLADLAAFRRGAALAAEIRATGGTALGEEETAAVTAAFDEALGAIAEAVVHYDRGRKLGAIERARSALARAVARLLVAAGIPPPDPVHGWVLALEHEVLPALAGLARWTERLPEGRR